MPRTCTVCPHADRQAIDSAVLSGESFRNIAKQFALSAAALYRHREHLPATLVKAQDAAEVAHADDLLREVRALRSKAYHLLLAAEKQGDIRTALLGVREARGCLELLGRVVGELDDQRPQINVLISPEWHQVRAVLLAALQPYPEARAAVALQLATVDGAHVG